MKHQYFGDVNDYLKYGILRALAKDDLQILICWMLTENDARDDGKFIQYLNDPNRWRAYDPELYDALKEEVMTRNRRDVACVMERNLIQHASFVDVILDGTPVTRNSWLGELRRKRKNTDLVFFDPDNGIEVKSIPMTRRNSRKYVYWRELKETWQSGMSLLVYQHFRREQRNHFIARLGSEFRVNLESIEVYALRTARVIFLLAPQPKHTYLLVQRARSMVAQWQEQIQFQRV